MIVIKVELWSANTREKTELARMHISNVETGDYNFADYVGKTFRGRKTKDLDRLVVNRTGEVIHWPRHRLHIWKLVAKMLNTMGY